MTSMVDTHVRSPYAEYIRDESKALELRLKRGRFIKIKVGDVLNINEGLCYRKVVAIREYTDIDEVIKNEDIHRIVPNAEPTELKQRVFEIYGNKLRSFHILIFELKPYKP